MATPRVESAGRSRAQLLLARDLGYIAADDHKRLDECVNEVRRMLNAFIQRLANS